MKIFTILALLALCFDVVAQETELTSASVPSRSAPLPATGPTSEATTIVQNFFGKLNTPSPVIPPLVDEITNEFKKEETEWQVTPPVNRPMSAAPPIRSQEATFAAASLPDSSRTKVLEVNHPQEPRVVKAASSDEMARASFGGAEVRSTKKPVATAKKPANIAAIFKGDAEPEKAKRAKQPLFKNLFSKKSKEISVEK